ncbi:prenyltransferase/squalene oxidase repeat-containing protein [Lentzea sp. NPDC051208]|uniref:prenyltransferase/squalene oxidase repeat-containing protein n=1 Tax=Lentzea sp. NPDC051208 TaxID=3154642 RepID=UPI00343C0482
MESEHDSAVSLLAESLSDPWGAVSASCYDTAHVVRAWARGTGRVPDELGRSSLRYLLRNQNPDGSWGPTAVPADYRALPTLAAICGILAVINAAPALEADELAGPVRLALERIAHDLADLDPDLLPDLTAIENLLPALLGEVLEHLDSGPARWPMRERIAQALARCGPWRDGLAKLRAHAADGGPIREQLYYTWELFDLPECTPPTPATGHVGGSPAATAAALARASNPWPEAVDYLSHGARVLDGGQPHTAPIPVFDRVWVLTSLLRSGFTPSYEDREQIVEYLRSQLAPEGLAAGVGLPIDSDDTAAVLFLLSLLGADADPTCLLTFEADTRFTVYHAVERTPSVSTNAHVLEALTAAANVDPGRTRLRTAAAKAQAFLLDTQLDDGSWVDKWHASPFYATACAALALDYADRAGSVMSLRRVIDWLLDSQRPDGAWGTWCGTLEETAYAVQLLRLIGRHHRGAAVTTAADRGHRFLLEGVMASAHDPVRTPMWQLKELYQPTRIVAANVLAAVRLGHHAPRHDRWM